MSKMTEVKTAELSGAALDWAVAQAEGLHGAGFVLPPIVDEHNQPAVLLNKERWIYGVEPAQIYSPSTDWSQGGPLIEKYKLDLGAPMESKQGPWNANTEWGHPLGCKGETPLLAACRSIVAAKLGDVVQVPAELVEIQQ